MKKYSFKQTIATEVGSILHKGLEIKANYIIKGEEVDYESIISTVELGCLDDSPTGITLLNGTNNIRDIYLNDWYDCDNKSGMDYDEKLHIYLSKVLPTRINGCNVIGAEVPFEFVYNDRVIIHGFIDRVDKLPNGYKVIDYKSSKATFPDTKIKTPMQFVIYDLACEFLYEEHPVAHEYDFIVLDKKQTEGTGLCTSGYFKRGIKKLDKILDQMEKAEEYVPKPTPLCYWCDYCCNTPNSDERFNDLCKYYSLWTPEHKTFKTNMNYK